MGAPPGGPLPTIQIPEMALDYDEAVRLVRAGDTQAKSPEDAPLPTAIVHQVQQQLEFYFSPANLRTDFFLRSRMDARRSVSVKLIAGFNRCAARVGQRPILTPVGGGL